MHTAHVDEEAYHFRVFTAIQLILQLFVLLLQQLIPFAEPASFCFKFIIAFDKFREASRKFSVPHLEVLVETLTHGTGILDLSGALHEVIMKILQIITQCDDVICLCVPCGIIEVVVVVGILTRLRVAVL